MFSELKADILFESHYSYIILLHFLSVHIYMVIRLSNYRTIPIANSKAITRTDDVVIRAASLFDVGFEVDVLEALDAPGAVNVDPLLYTGAVGAALAGQVALGATGQDISWQIDCGSAASPGTIAAGGEQR